MKFSHAAVGHYETTGTQDCVKAGAIQHVPALLDSPNRVSALNITQHSVLISHGQLGNGHNNK